MKNLQIVDVYRMDEILEQLQWNPPKNHGPKKKCSRARLAHVS